MGRFKFLFIVAVLGFGGIYLLLDTPSEKQGAVGAFFNQPTQQEKAAVVAEFANSIEKTPEIMAAVKSDRSSEVVLEDAIQKLFLDPNADIDTEKKQALRAALFARKTESIPLVMSHYAGLDRESNQYQTSKLLEIAVDLCNGETDRNCTDFLSREAFNESLKPREQLSSLMGYMNTRGLSHDEKNNVFLRFKSKYGETDMKSELDAIEQNGQNN